MHLTETWKAEAAAFMNRDLSQVDYVYLWVDGIHLGIRLAEGQAVLYDYPAEHLVHLRTTNPIESTVAIVRLRTKVTKGHGSKAAGLAMAFKLIESAQRRWRMVNAPQLVALVRAGATLVNGKLAERPADPQPADAAAYAFVVLSAASWPRRRCCRYSSATRTTR